MRWRMPCGRACVSLGRAQETRAFLLFFFFSFLFFLFFFLQAYAAVVRAIQLR
jgi:hypothetical protein